MTAAARILWLACCAGAHAATPGEVCFEAEHANSIKPVMELARAPGASRGVALVIPEGAASLAGPRDRGHASYRIHIPVAGRYYTWFRVMWHGNCSNSLFYFFKPRTMRMSIMDNLFGKWHWVQGNCVALDEGPADLVLQYREDGVWVDQVLLTTDGDETPRGARAANCIPEPVGESELAVFISVGGSSAAPMPPTEFRLHHSDESESPGPPERRLCIFPDRKTEFTAWLRNNSLRPGKGKAVIAAPKGVIAGPRDGREYEFHAEEALLSLGFSLSAEPDLPRGLHQVELVVIGPEGKLHREAVLAMRPFQWLATERVRLRKSRGLDQRTAVERGDPLAGAKWHVVPEDSFTTFGFLNMKRAVAPDDFSLAYAYTEVDAPHGGRYLIHVAHDDMIEVWINSRKVFRDNSSRPAGYTRRLVPVELREGRNTVLVKLCQFRNYWEFLLEFRNPDGTPADVTGRRVESLLEGRP